MLIFIPLIFKSMIKQVSDFFFLFVLIPVSKLPGVKTIDFKNIPAPIYLLNDATFYNYITSPIRDKG